MTDSTNLKMYKFNFGGGYPFERNSIRSLTKEIGYDSIDGESTTEHDDDEKYISDLLQSMRSHVSDKVLQKVSRGTNFDDNCEVFKNFSPKGISAVDSMIKFVSIMVYYNLGYTDISFFPPLIFSNIYELGFHKTESTGMFINQRVQNYYKENIKPLVENYFREKQMVFIPYYEEKDDSCTIFVVISPGSFRSYSNNTVGVVNDEKIVPMILVIGPEFFCTPKNETLRDVMSFICFMIDDEYDRKNKKIDKNVHPIPQIWCEWVKDVTENENTSLCLYLFWFLIKLTKLRPELPIKYKDLSVTPTNVDGVEEWLLDKLFGKISDICNVVEHDDLIMKDCNLLKKKIDKICKNLSLLSDEVSREYTKRETSDVQLLQRISDVMTKNDKNCSLIETSGKIPFNESEIINEFKKFGNPQRKSSNKSCKCKDWMREKETKKFLKEKKEIIKFTLNPPCLRYASVGRRKQRAAMCYLDRGDNEGLVEFNNKNLLVTSVANGCQIDKSVLVPDGGNCGFCMLSLVLRGSCNLLQKLQELGNIKNQLFFVDSDKRKIDFKQKKIMI